MILVACADPEITDALSSAMSALGVVITAATAQAALGSLENASVVVLDLLAPGIDGAAFKEAEVPVIVISAHGVRPVLIADRYIMPFTLERLHEAVSKARAASGQEFSKAA